MDFLEAPAQATILLQSIQYSVNPRLSLHTLYTIHFDYSFSVVRRLNRNAISQCMANFKNGRLHKVYIVFVIKPLIIIEELQCSIRDGNTNCTINFQNLLHLNGWAKANYTIMVRSSCCLDLSCLAMELCLYIWPSCFLFDGHNPHGKNRYICI